MPERECQTSANPTERNASSSESVELAALLQARGQVRLKVGETLAEARAATDQPSKGLTLELSGARQRVRLNDWLGAK